MGVELRDNGKRVVVVTKCWSGKQNPGTSYVRTICQQECMGTLSNIRHMVHKNKVHPDVAMLAICCQVPPCEGKSLRWRGSRPSSPGVPELYTPGAIVIPDFSKHHHQKKKRKGKESNSNHFVLHSQVRSGLHSCILPLSRWSRTGRTGCYNPSSLLFFVLIFLAILENSPM